MDNSPRVEKRKAFRDLRHDFENVSEIRIRTTFVHDVEKRASMDALLQNHHLVQDTYIGKNIRILFFGPIHRKQDSSIQVLNFNFNFN